MTAAQRPAIGYGAAARHYRKAGWTGVLPLDPGTKWPPPKGYTGWDGRDPTATDTLNWAHRASDNLALRLPRGVIGIDVDEYGSKKGADTLTELEARYGPLPPTWSSTSRGPGPSRIYLYRCPPELILPGTPGDSIEFIQHHHRYTVAWPSVVEGRQYRWYGPDLLVAARPPYLHELEWLPDDWHQIKAPPRPTGLDYVPRAVSGDWSTAVGKYHAEGVEGLRSGSRHDAMLPVVMTLIRLDNDGHPGASEALDDLHGRFITAIADRANPKDAEKEWARMETGAVTKVAATPSLRGSYETLKATWEPIDDLHSLIAPPRPTQPADDEPEASQAEEEDGWELVDLDPYLTGTYKRPQPTFLRRNP